MAVTDQQLEQLEAYLDGELPAGEEEALRSRIDAEPEMAEAVESLQAQRNLLARVWLSYEPDDDVARRVIMRIEAAVDRDLVWTGRLSKLRIASAAAACILVGFLVGWVGRGSSGNADRNLFLANGAGNTPLVNSPTFPTSPRPQQMVSFPLRNQQGDVIGYQRFDSPQRAFEFIDDLTRWQQKQEQIKNGNLDTSERF